jgi:hypothetical protein
MGEVTMEWLWAFMPVLTVALAMLFRVLYWAELQEGGEPARLAIYEVASWVFAGAAAVHYGGVL